MNTQEHTKSQSVRNDYSFQDLKNEFGETKAKEYMEKVKKYAATSEKEIHHPCILAKKLILRDISPAQQDKITLERFIGNEKMIGRYPSNYKGFSVEKLPDRTVVWVNCEEINYYDYLCEDIPGIVDVKHVKGWDITVRTTQEFCRVLGKIKAEIS